MECLQRRLHSKEGREGGYFEVVGTGTTQGRKREERAGAGKPTLIWPGRKGRERERRREERKC